MKIDLVEVQESEKSVLRQLIELYSYDFSEFDGADVSEHGFYGYTYLDHYWTEDARHPFFIRVDGKLAGFVLISDYAYVLETGQARSVSEFFVMRKYRHKGIGRKVAFQVFEKFPGKWEVIQHEHNLPSIRFWKKVIHEYTGGNFRVEKTRTEWWDGQALIFDNREKY